MRVSLNRSLAHWMPVTATTARHASHILPIALALVVLPAIVLGSPPDSSWVVGIYDRADGDEIVTLVAESAAAPSPLLAQLPPPLRLCERIPGLGLVIIHRLSTGLYTRGPPPTPCVYVMAAHVSPPQQIQMYPVTRSILTSLVSIPITSRASSNVRFAKATVHPDLVAKPLVLAHGGRSWPDAPAPG